MVAVNTSPMISANYQRNLQGCLFLICLPYLYLIPYVKDVTPMYMLPFLDQEERVSVVTKCPTEKEPTTHEAIKVVPMVTDIDNIDPMDVLKLSKRLVICQSCGNMRLIN